MMVSIDMKKIVCIQILLWMSCLINVSAQDSYKEYEQKVYVSSQGDSLQYCLLRPEVEKPGEKYPLVLFLHGAGERGNDNRKQLKHGGQMWLNPVNRKKYPAFILLPQCPAENYWGYEMRPNSLEPFGMPDNPELTTTIRTLKSLLDTFLDMPQVDKLRVYIMGLSMGGMATYDMVIRYPEIFAAAVPICGTVNPVRIGKELREIKFRIFHGDTDSVVTPEGSREAYKALKAIDASVEYIEFVGCDHNSWNPAFNYPDFMNWLFNQRKVCQNAHLLFFTHKAPTFTSWGFVIT